MTETFPRGRFAWYELLTTDPDAARAFYPAVTGWGTAPFGGAGEPYTLWMNGEAPVGGMMELPAMARNAGAPPHWLAYIGTPDIDATVRDAEGRDATLLHRGEVADMGKWAVLRDPQGAVFAAHQSAGEPGGHDGEPAVGEFSWNELYTTDQEAAFAFYAGLFGWEKTEALDMGEAGIYQMFGRAGRTMGGMMTKTADMPGPPAWLFYTRVPDVDRAAELVTENGGTILNGPMDVPGGDRIVQCADPQGAAFALHSRAAG